MILAIIIICIALLFEFINGFHDVANIVSSSVSSKSLSPYQAIIISAAFNFIGAFVGKAVINTINGGLIDPNCVSYILLISSLTSAISWSLLTWYFGIPSSSSHALIGSIFGSTIAVNSFHSLHWDVLINKVIIPMILAPIIAFSLTFTFVMLLYIFFRKKQNPRKINAILRELQVVSIILLAISHGSNDAQKTMSVITLILFTFALIDDVTIIPIWVIIICAVTLAIGTLSGGMRIIKTLSTRIAKIIPLTGFASEMSSGLIVFIASNLGFPISTTQAAAGSIISAGYLNNGKINTKIVILILSAWISTLPCCMIFSFIICKLFLLFNYF